MRMVRKYRNAFTFTVLLLLAVETSNSEKFCRIRNLPLYPQELWNDVAGYYCYNYTNDYRLQFIYNTSAVSKYQNNESYLIPVTWINRDTYFTYNYKNDSSLKNIYTSFKTDQFFEMWKDCCRAAEECCNNTLTNENIEPVDGYCPALWDGWSCFGPAKKDTIEKKVCPQYVFSSNSGVCDLESEKECLPDGKWNQKTNYGTCAIAPVLRNRHNFNIISLAVATVLAFPAVVIFFSLRAFRNNLRYVMHRNLILVIIIRNLLSIVSKKIIILDAINSTDGHSVMEKNSVACRILAFFENAAKNGMFACMLADGFYLHKQIVRAFAKDPDVTSIYVTVLSIVIYLVINFLVMINFAALSFLPSLIWALVRDSRGAGDCWMIDTTNDQWIIDGFRIGILGINFLLLLDIIRVMTIKLKRGGISQQAKSTLRATLFLIPLFGIHIIVIADRDMVPGNSCYAEDIYLYISYLIQALQGVMVATLFCYISSEVRGELKNAFRKFVLFLESRSGFSVSKSKIFRRETGDTFVKT